MLHYEIIHSAIFMSKTKYQIDIDGYIGEWYYSKRFVKNELSKYPGQLVRVRMNSLGGSLDHGLDIAERFAEHANVEVDLFGFNASAATLATLKAKRVKISSCGFYLIHKVMNWVDIWGQMNADQITKAIEELEKNKEENQKMDLVIAQMYSDKTGKAISEILNLMKVGGWLTAQEAKDWGFVDEIIKDKEKVNLKEMGDKLNSFGLPINFISKTNFFTNIKTSEPMNKQPLRINAILKVDQLESTDSDGVFLNEAQIDNIDSEIENLEGKVNTLTTEKTNAEERANTAETTLAEKETEISQLKTQVENLKKNPGAQTQGTGKESDAKESEGNEDEFFNIANSAKELYDILP